MINFSFLRLKKSNCWYTLDKGNAWQGGNLNYVIPKNADVNPLILRYQLKGFWSIRGWRIQCSTFPDRFRD